MAQVYVAASRELGKWGGDVGLTKHLYKLGVAEDGADADVTALNERACAGFTDWKLVRKEPVEEADETALIDRLAGRERMVDPGLYPKIRGERGIFKVKPENVESHLLVKFAMENQQQELKALKIKPADIAAYLIANALR